MVKSAIVAAILCGTAWSGASAATLQNFTMVQNEWTVLEFASDSANITINPINTDGSFSFTFAFSDNGCGAGADKNNTWSCMPKDFATNTVKSGYSHNFGEGWFDKENHGSVKTPFDLSYVKQGAEKLYMYFRVTSGSGSISQVASAPIETPAPVPLPAAGLLMLAGLGALGAASKLRRTA